MEVSPLLFLSRYISLYPPTSLTAFVVLALTDLLANGQMALESDGLLLRPGPLPGAAGQGAYTRPHPEPFLSLTD